MFVSPGGIRELNAITIYSAAPNMVHSELEKYTESVFLAPNANYIFAYEI